MPDLVRFIASSEEGRTRLQSLLEQPYSEACRVALGDLSSVWAASQIKPASLDTMKRHLLSAVVRLGIRGGINLRDLGWPEDLAESLGVDLDRAIQSARRQGVE